MKKIVLFLFIILISVVIANSWDILNNNKSIIFHESDESEKEANKSGFSLSETSVTIDVEDVYTGDLLLVNQEHNIEEKAKTDIINLYENKELTGDYGLLNTDIKLSKEITSYFNKMMEDAQKDGVDNFLISSGYRGFEKQTQLYDEMGKDSALPAGFSEHQLGLSLDVGSSEGSMAESEEGEWIAKHAWKHGFILRYPPNKTDITGIKYEPWHIRYVGKPHSVIMHNNNFVLEEYLSFLKEQKETSVTIEGKNYEVRYYTVSEPLTIRIPKKHNYTISGDNVGGVIVTISK